VVRVDEIKFHATGWDRAMPTGAVTRLPFYMAIPFRAVHDIAELKSINTQSAYHGADRAAINAREITRRLVH
jgi:hypothetical protein